MTRLMTARWNFNVQPFCSGASGGYTSSDRAVKIIQHAIRESAARRKLKQKRGEMRYLEFLRPSVTRIQRHVRGWVKRRIEAARRIQRRVRKIQEDQSALLELLVQKLLRVRSRAAIKVQRFARGWLARRAYREELECFVLKWIWDPPGMDVQVTGNFTWPPWTVLPMRYCHVRRAYVTAFREIHHNGQELKLKAGHFRKIYKNFKKGLKPLTFKFRVNYQWVCDGSLPIIKDKAGNPNNVMLISPQSWKGIRWIQHQCWQDEKADAKDQTLSSATSQLRLGVEQPSSSAKTLVGQIARSDSHRDSEKIVPLVMTKGWTFGSNERLADAKGSSALIPAQDDHRYGPVCTPLRSRVEQWRWVKNLFARRVEAVRRIQRRFRKIQEDRNASLEVLVLKLSRRRSNAATVVQRFARGWLARRAYREEFEYFVLKWIWDPPGLDVQVTGDFTWPPWTPVPMRYCHARRAYVAAFKKIHLIAKNCLTFKFRVNHQWVCDRSLSMVEDEVGDLNNVISIGPQLLKTTRWRPSPSAIQRQRQQTVKRRATDQTRRSATTHSANDVGQSLSAKTQVGQVSFAKTPEFQCAIGDRHQGQENVVPPVMVKTFWSYEGLADAKLPSSTNLAREKHGQGPVCTSSLSSSSSSSRVTQQHSRAHCSSFFTREFSVIRIQRRVREWVKNRLTRRVEAARRIQRRVRKIQEDRSIMAQKFLRARRAYREELEYFVLNWIWDALGVDAQVTGDFTQPPWTPLPMRCSHSHRAYVRAFREIHNQDKNCLALNYHHHWVCDTSLPMRKGKTGNLKNMILIDPQMLKDPRQRPSPSPIQCQWLHPVNGRAEDQAINSATTRPSSNVGQSFSLAETHRALTCTLSPSMIAQWNFVHKLLARRVEAAKRIQRRFRKIQEDQNALLEVLVLKLSRRRSNAAIEVQRFARGWLARRAYREKLEYLVLKCYLGYLRPPVTQISLSQLTTLLQLVQSITPSVIRIQRHIRNRLARRNEAARRIQRRVREIQHDQNALLEVLVFELSKLRLNAAIEVQRFARGWLARQAYREELECFVLKWIWDPPGMDVHVTGNFTWPPWTLLPMRYCHARRAYVTALRESNQKVKHRLTFKFRVNHRWVCDVLLPTIRDSAGNINNVIFIDPQLLQNT